MLIALSFTTNVAAAARVAVVSTGSRCSADSELVRQVRAELASAGFEVVKVDAVGDTDRPALIETAARTRSVAAIGCVLGEPDVTLAVEVVARGARSGESRSFDAGQTGAEHTTALRIAEFLHAVMLEVSAPRPEHAPGLDETASEPRFRAALGGTAAVSPGGIPVGVAPAGSFGVRVMPTLWGELRIVGPLLSTHTGRPEGSARVDQEMLGVGPRWTFLARGRAQAFASSAIGAYRLGVSGRAAPPFESLDGSAVVGAAWLGAGAAIAVVPGELGLHFMLRSDAIFVLPEATIRFAGTRIARAGQPIVAGTAAMELSF